MRFALSTTCLVAALAFTIDARVRGNPLDTDFYDVLIQ
jgi:hypothetical protein